MTTEATAPAAAIEQPPVAQPEPDQAQWDALAKELDIEQEEQPEPEKVEPAATESTQQQQAPPKPTYDQLEVNYKNLQAAVREARTKEQQASDRLAGITDAIKGLQAQRQQPKQEDVPKIPEVQEDPIGHYNARLAQLENMIQGLHQGGQQTQQQLQAQQQEQQFWGHVQSAEAEFRKQASDYDAACDHLAATRVKELEIMLPDNSPGAVQAAQRYGLQSPAQLREYLFNQDRVAVATQAVQLGMNPAQLYYNLAKQRGYASPAANPAIAGGNPPTQKAQQQVAAAQRGQKAAISISGSSGGRKAADEMSITDLAELYAEDGDAADAVFNKMKRAGLLG